MQIRNKKSHIASVNFAIYMKDTIFYTTDPGVVDRHHKTPIKKRGKAECCNFLLCIQAQCLKVMGVLWTRTTQGQSADETDSTKR